MIVVAVILIIFNSAFILFGKELDTKLGFRQHDCIGVLVTLLIILILVLYVLFSALTGG